MFSLFHIKWYLYCCREFLVRLHTTPFLGLWLFVLPVVFPLLSLYIYICIYIYLYIYCFLAVELRLSPNQFCSFILNSSSFIWSLCFCFGFRFSTAFLLVASLGQKLQHLGNLGCSFLNRYMYRCLCLPESMWACVLGHFCCGFIFFFSFALLFVFGGQQKYHTSIIEFDTINCSSRDKKLRPIPSTDWLLLLSLTFKAASALIYKLILLNFVAQRVALLGLLVRLLFRARMSRKQRPQLLQHTSNTRRICCNSCPNWPICAASSEFGTLTHLMVMVRLDCNA